MIRGRERNKDKIMGFMMRKFDQENSQLLGIPRGLIIVTFL